MPFSASIKEEALVKSRRCCCICHEFAGLYVNVHHIQQEADGGPNTLDNAIVLCLRCHGEVGHYNAHHPLGNKYTSSEIRRHRDEWWEFCASGAATALPKKPISVSPSLITLRPGSYRPKTDLKIYNTSDDFFYEIYVKLTISSKEFDTSTLEVIPQKWRKRLEARTGNIIVNPDVHQILGTDANDNPAILLRLLSLEPKEKRRFEVSLTTPVPYEVNITIMLRDFSFEPAPVLERTNEVAVRIHLSEDFRIRAIRQPLKRTRR